MKKLLAITLILVSAASFAATNAPFANNTRALGMGGAYTAIVNNSDSMMWNPAGTAKGSDFHIDLLDLNIETDQKTVDFLSYFINNSSVFTQPITLWTATTIATLSNANIKLNVSDKFAITGINGFFGLGNVAVGAFAIVNANVATSYDILNINAAINGNLDLVGTLNISGMIDYGLNGLFDSILSGTRLGAGVTGKLINRWQMNEVRSAFDISGLDPKTMLNKLSNPVQGYGFDLGVNLYLPAISSTLSFVGKDLFESIGASPVNSSWNLGYGLKIAQGFVADVDVYDVLGTSTFLNKLHAGAEIDVLAGIIIIRGGIYQGYPSFGADLFGFIKYADYGVELGTYPGQLENRYHRLSICLGI